jgi:ech hydrogenase subunit B
LSAVPLALKAHGFSISDVFDSSDSLFTSVWLTFIALLIALVILMRKSPFDISSSEHAHQELVRGLLTEYSGPYLAIIEIAHWCELVLVLALLGLFWASGSFWWLSIIVPLASWFVILVIDNVSARLTWQRMIGYSWGIGVVLVALNIVFINRGWM